MRREIPLLITGIVGISFVIQYFVPHYPFNKLSDWFSDWFSIIQACAIILGSLNLLKLSFEKIFKKKTDWGYSVIIIASFLLITVIGLSEGEGFRVPGTKFDWLFNYMYIPTFSNNVFYPSVLCSIGIISSL